MTRSLGFLAAVDLLLHALEPFVGLPGIAGAERGQVDLGVQQLPQVPLVRFEGDRGAHTVASASVRHPEEVGRR